MTSAFLTFGDAWRNLGPEIILTVFAFVIMIVEFIVTGTKKQIAPWLSVIGIIVAMIVTAARLSGVPGLSLPVNAVDDFGTIFKLLLLLSSGLVILLAIGSRKQESLPYEYSYLVLFATVGAMIMASATDLITMYVGLELLSITTYILVALYKKSIRSSEGGLKYLIIGSIASATFLYGLSFLYGMTGSTQLGTIIANVQSGWSSYPGMMFLSLALIIVGLGVKLSVAPFHLWTADVYEGAPTPVSAYLAVVSKAAAFALLLRLLIAAYGQGMGQWYGIVAWLAVITMVIGNVGALTQKNVKRLLAYSSIAQAGYLLVPFAAIGQTATTANISQGLSAIVFYLFAYALMTIGAFAIFAVVAGARASEGIDAFNGLYRRSPWLASAMAIFLLSLAGMPLTAGFFGKFLIFLVAFNTSQYWLGVLLFATSVIAFYYYFAILRAMFMREPVGDRDPVKGTGVMHVVVTLCVVGTLVLGVFPSSLMGLLNGLHWFG